MIRWTPGQGTLVASWAPHGDPVQPASPACRDWVGVNHKSLNGSFRPLNQGGQSEVGAQTGTHLNRPEPGSF